jgi:PqqD family protein of HPr-rel-A system
MKPRKNIAISEAGFIFNPVTGDSFSVNLMAAEILEALRNGQSEDEIISALTKKYEVEKSQLQKDLHDFFADLKAHNLVEA